jgi:hypothetical protein
MHCTGWQPAHGARLSGRGDRAAGSVARRALAEDLDRRGIRSKPQRLSDDRTVGGGRFGVGGLANLLKNRFYIGEVVYRGDVHRGEHEPILDRVNTRLRLH